MSSPMPGTLRGVALGAGYFSHFQYEAWNRIPEVEITALYNRTESKAREAAERHRIPRHYSDWRAMLDAEQPDFVDIITPPETHEELCAEAATRGIHIICQKPLAPTMEESRRIVETARTAGVRFLVHENWRWQPWYRKIKDLRQDGLLGDITHCYFRMRTGDGWGQDAYLARQPFFRHYPRLLVYETGVHFIDTFRFLMGEIVEVYANLRRLNPVIQGEETGQLFFRHASGATSILDANRFNESESEDPRFTFGDLRLDAMHGHLTMDTNATLRFKPLGEPAQVIEYPHERRGFAGDCVYALQRHFVDSMRSGTAFESTGEDYLKTLAVVDAVYESAARREVVRLPAT
ncbi:MAG: Gfo/Idh/MocA family oxidoreductase [Bryobacterales bacterium]|nr:Gfo/Idh/MocA family oxidoreductase [Bryobacterales bacterium]